MKFTLIYENKEEIRKQIEEMVLGSFRLGFNFSEHNVTHNLFQSVTQWPTREELSRLKFNIQVEMVEIKDGELISLRKLITDVEEIKSAEPAP